jgi:SAM-dependent methyltransferase
VRFYLTELIGIVMQRALEQLIQLANLAVEYQKSRHGSALSLEQVDSMREVLRSVREWDAVELESVAAWYGAWLGQECVRRFDAQWIGLSEPVAPRIRLNGYVFSPIDAVRRALLAPDEFCIKQVVDQIQKWGQPSDLDEGAARRQNAQVWNAELLNSEFSGCSALPRNQGEALAAVDPWLSEAGIVGRRLLCLGAGGGRHAPLHAIAGAQVTVLDIASAQLAIDEAISRELGLNLQIVQGSMDNLTMLKDQSFDLVLQPVSACYIPDLDPLYSEVARVLRIDGHYLIQHKQPSILQSRRSKLSENYEWVTPAIEGQPLPPSSDADPAYRENAAKEFLHSYDAMLGGLCRAGFVIEALMEPPRADALAPVDLPEHQAWYMPPYLKVKARRVK